MAADWSLGGGIIEMSKETFVNRLHRSISSRTPFAAVRFGDGESRMLRADPDNAGSMRLARKQAARQSGHVLDLDQLLEVKAALEHARREADVLGIHAPTSGKEVDQTWMNHEPALAARVAEGGTPVYLGSPNLHHMILPELPRLLAGRPVSVITCRNVKPILEARWDVNDVRVYQIPSQHMVRDLDDIYEAAMHSIPIWPDAIDKVHSALVVREPGEVFLVGAGVFGKDLCIRARDQGGIALDMGSALDHISGKLTRAYVRAVFKLHMDGMSAIEIADCIHERFQARPDPGNIRELIANISPYIR